MDRSRTSAAERVAKALSDLAGDGCIVRLEDRRRRTLKVAAVQHRERARREELATALDGEAGAGSGGWSEQCFAKHHPFRLQGSTAAAAVGGTTALPGAGVQAAILVPLRVEGQMVGVATVFRDETWEPYGPRDQELVEQLAGNADPAPAVPEASAPEAKHARILEHTATGVWVTDMAGTTTYVNDALSQLLGLPAADLEGAPMAEYIDRLPATVRTRFTSQTECQDHRVLTADGAEVWVSITSTPLTDDRGRRLGTVNTLTEVGRRKRLEVDLRLRLEAQEAVTTIATKALAGVDLRVLVADSSEAVADLLETQFVSICELSPDARTLVPVAVKGWNPVVLGEVFPVLEDGLGRLSLDDDEPVIINDFTAQDALVRPDQAAGMLSAVCISVPERAAVITAHSERARAFADRDLSFLRPLASLLGSRWTAPVAPLAEPVAVG